MHLVCLTVNREWLRNTEAGTGSCGAVNIVTVLVVILYQGLLRVVNHNKLVLIVTGTVTDVPQTFPIL